MESTNLPPKGSYAGDSPSEPEENTPLLERDPTEPSQTQVLHHGRSAFYVWIIILFLVLFLTMVNGLFQAPQQRIMESVFCKYHYQEHDPSKIGLDGEIEEIWCKIPEVHKPLASLRGWMDAVESIPGILLPIPFGILADRIGRKPVLLMAAIGLFLEFFTAAVVLFFHNTISITLILIAPLFQFFGGGAAVALATALTMVADSVLPEERAAVYFRISGGAMIGPLIGYPLAALLMKISPYLSILVSLVVALFTIIGSVALPETLNLLEARKQREIAAAGRAHLPKDTLSQKALAGVVHVVQSTQEIFHHHAVLWLMPLFLVSAATQIAMDFLLQYASEKFQWSFSNASILPEIHTLVNGVVLIGILPYISQYLTATRGMPAARKDLLIVRICLIITIIGLLLVGIAPGMFLLILSIVFYSLGGAFIPATRAILVGLVKPEQNARLFALVGVVTYLGSFICSPLIAKIYGWGLTTGGLWLGAPFLLTGLLVALVAIPVFVLRFQGDNDDARSILSVGRDAGRDQADALTLVSEDIEEERERERLSGSKYVGV